MDNITIFQCCFPLSHTPPPLAAAAKAPLDPLSLLSPFPPPNHPLTGDGNQHKHAPLLPYVNQAQNSTLFLLLALLLLSILSPRPPPGPPGELGRKARATHRENASQSQSSRRGRRCTGCRQARGLGSSYRPLSCSWEQMRSAALLLGIPGWSHSGSVAPLTRSTAIG